MFGVTTVITVGDLWYKGQMEKCPWFIELALEVTVSRPSAQILDYNTISC